MLSLPGADGVIRSYGGSFTFEANPIDDMPATAYSYDTTKG